MASPTDSGRAAAWAYFGAIQQAGVADVFHYSVALRHCNTLDGLEQLQREMAAAGVEGNHGTAAATHSAYAAIGEPKRAIETIVAGMQDGAWATAEHRKRVVGLGARTLLKHGHDESVIEYLALAEEAELLQCPDNAEEAPTLHQEPYYSLLQQAQGRGEGGTELSRKNEEQLLHRLVEHCSARAPLDGRGCALLLRRATALRSPSLASAALLLLDTDRTTRSKLITHTLRRMMDEEGGAANAVALMDSLSDASVPLDAYQFRLMLRRTPTTESNRASVVRWLDGASLAHAEIAGLLQRWKLP